MAQKSRPSSTPRCFQVKNDPGWTFQRSDEFWIRAQLTTDQLTTDKIANSSGGSMSKTAIVTGAGSGVGRAVALKLVHDGWNVGLVGRRNDALLETIKLAGPAGAKMLSAAGDVGDPSQVAAGAKLIAEKFGPAQVLVAAAGLNIPKRSWEVLSFEDYQHVMNTNLSGTFNWVQVVLPAMRQAGNGTI